MKKTAAPDTADNKKPQVEKQAFIRTGKKSDVSSPFPLSQVRKIAKLLILLGKKQATEVMKSLESEIIEPVVAEIATITAINPLEAEKILEEFHIHQEKQKELKGGPDVAREMLNNAFGKVEGEVFLRKALPQGERKLFDFLEDIDVRHLRALLKEESDEVVSIVLAHAPASVSSAFIEGCEPEKKLILVKRIAALQKIDRQVLVSIQDALKERLHVLGDVETDEMDGINALAEILKHSNYSTSEKILKSLEDEDEKVYQRVHDRIFTIESLEDIDDKSLQDILHDMENERIALILKGKDDNIRKKVLKNVSERRRLLIMEEYSRMGAVPRRDVDSATSEFVGYLRKLEDEGTIIIKSRDDEYVE